jgi:hypothetical protein
MNVSEKPILPHPRSVNRDMKLYSRLLGGIGIPTKSCVSPQVFYGGMRQAGSGFRTTAAGGVKPSEQCGKPGSLKPGALLELETMVK